MLSLATVSTRGLLAIAESKRYANKYQQVYELLIRYKIYNYQNLQDMLTTGLLQAYSEDVIRYLSTQLSAIETRIKNVNESNRKIDIYTFDKCIIGGLDEETINITDSSTKGIALLLKGIVNYNYNHSTALDNLSIAQIKDYLGHLTEGKNRGLENELNRYAFGFSRDKTARVVEAINFYDEQILRQASETTERGIDLFSLNKREKEIIIASQIKEIAGYFIEHAVNCVWGPLTDAMSQKLEESVYPTEDCIKLEIRKRLIEIVSNYVTLEEAKNGLVKRRVLDRFIIYK